MDQIVVHTDKIVWQEWCGQIDQEIRKKEPKKKPQHGKRADFLAQYKVVGYEKAKEIIYDIAIPYVKKNHVFLDDYKSLLQEYTQTTKNTLEYKVVDESGPAHDKRFVVEVRIDNMIFGKGKGKSKKEAEQNAAYDAYLKIAK